jgi:hypothetical protein
MALRPSPVRLFGLGLVLWAGAAGSQPAASGGGAWQLSGSLGMLQFVVVAEARARDRSVYDEAIAALCQSTCFLRFFTNSANAPVSVPLPDAILAQPAAMYQRSAKQGNEIFQWSCRLGMPGGTASRVLAASGAAVLGFSGIAAPRPEFDCTACTSSTSASASPHSPSHPIRAICT